MDRPIYLVGMMGSGKTTVGRALAASRGVPFVDVDAAIEARAGCSIAEIFATRGENAFRVLEQTAIREFANEGSGVVVALGGGAVVSEETRSLLRTTATTVWLEAPPALLASRTSGQERPLLAGLDLEGREARLGELLDERASFYAEAAALRIDAAGGGPDEVAQTIAAALAERGW